MSVRADSSIPQVAEALAEYDLSGLPVIDRDRAVVGVISQTDIVRLRARSMPTSGWHGFLVRDLMTQPAITVLASASLQEAARFMTEHCVHGLSTDNPVTRHPRMGRILDGAGRRSRSGVTYGPVRELAAPQHWVRGHQA